MFDTSDNGLASRNEYIANCLGASVIVSMMLVIMVKVKNKRVSKGIYLKKVRRRWDGDSWRRCFITFILILIYLYMIHDS